MIQKNLIISAVVVLVLLAGLVLIKDNTKKTSNINQNGAVVVESATDLNTVSSDLDATDLDQIDSQLNSIDSDSSGF